MSIPPQSTSSGWQPSSTQGKLMQPQQIFSQRVRRSSGSFVNASTLGMGQFENAQSLSLRNTQQRHSQSQKSLSLKAIAHHFIRPTQKIDGSLNISDRLFSKQGDPFAREFLMGDRFTDEYRLRKAKPGQQIHVNLNSFNFDTYLQLVDQRSGKVLLQSDDIELGITDSAFTFIVQPGINYVLRVSSFFPQATGNYTLTARSYQSDSTRKFNFAYGFGLVNAAAAVSRAVGTSFKATPSLEKNNWNLDLIRAPEVWQRGYTGKDTVVAVLDSGVDYLHPDLRANIWENSGEIAGNGIDDDRNGYIDDVRGWNFVNNNPDPMDENGHGTHVAGTIAASRNQIGVTGVAYDTKLMPVQVLDGSGFGTNANVARGIRYAVNNGADVINMSLGGNVLSAQEKAALRFARQQGVVVVMASGNDRQRLGSIRPSQPALSSALDLGIAVGAIDRGYRVADFSNPTGNRPLDYVVAPGVSIRSTVPGGKYESYDWSGTSMAAPHVAGIAALMLSAAPNLSPSEVEKFITATARGDRLTFI
jgi:hypothetical protein